MSVGASFTQSPMNNSTAFISANVLEETPSPVPRKPNKSLPKNARRPTTRSQTGAVAKRLTRDDDVLPEPKKRALPIRKRHKSASDSSAEPDSGSSHAHESASSKPPSTRGASTCSTSSMPVLPSTHEAQLTFYHSSMSETDQSQTRLPRSRASLPTPIPNLTKKSRGRRVPTKASTDVDSNQNDSRLYVCSVDGCGKCFHRGEHLKRHIRSIHTHEKPFKCTFPLCEKYFNRHDNLLQHLKVHRQANSLPDDPPPVPKRPLQQESHDTLASSASSTRRQSRRQHSYSQEEDDEAIAPARPRTIYDAYPPRYGSHPTTSSSSSSSVSQMIYGHFNRDSAASEKLGNVIDAAVSMHRDMGSHEAMSILTNVAVSSLRMEVSSLRTELPRSPVDVRSMVDAVPPC